MSHEDNYLSHHGIKGQKWGVRRFQNEDGTLTAEGRQKYGYDESIAPRQTQKTPAHVLSERPNRYPQNPQEQRNRWRDRINKENMAAARAEIKNLVKSTSTKIKKSKFQEKAVKRGEKLSEKGATQVSNAVAGLAKTASLTLITALGSTAIAASGHTRLASGVRALGSTFIIANQVQTLRNAYDMASYKHDKRLYRK